jgi:uncharacterized membrane protein (DUF106 family)
MLEFPLISAWLDMIIIGVVYSLIVKLIQHVLVNPKEYIQIRADSKKLNKEMQMLFKEQKIKEAQEKQKESLKLMQKQMSFTIKPMFVLMIVALPILWFIKKYYGELSYNFGIFTVSGFWAYVIIAMIASLIISNVYDKTLEKKYLIEKA